MPWNLSKLVCPKYDPKNVISLRAGLYISSIILIRFLFSLSSSFPLNPEKESSLVIRCSETAKSWLSSWILDATGEDILSKNGVANCSSDPNLRKKEKMFLQLQINVIV